MMPKSPDRATHEARRRALTAAISNAIVRELSGQPAGPTRAKTTLGSNAVFVVLQDTLTRGEQTLADAGERGRAGPAQALAEGREVEMTREIEALTGRAVIGFMSDNHIDPDLAVEVFVLEPLPRSGGERRPPDED